MNEPTERLTRQQLINRIQNSIPDQMDADQVIDGVILALKPAEERTRPLERGIGRSGVVYAWHESDASVTNMALEVLTQLGLSFLTGPAGVANLGVALKELICFLIQLNRHRVRVSDPVEVSVLLVLADTHSGLTSLDIRQKLVKAHGRDNSPSLSDVEKALARLANSVSATSHRPLVRADGQIWKSLV
jgi:hypothetical protein